jgi:hypothetical protein
MEKKFIQESLGIKVQSIVPLNGLTWMHAYSERKWIIALRNYPGKLWKNCLGKNPLKFSSMPIRLAQIGGGL